MKKNSLHVKALPRISLIFVSPDHRAVWTFCLSRGLMKRGFYYAGLVNIDCLLRIGFLIWAIAKYRDESPSLQPSA